MLDYLYQDERGDIIITPMITQRGGDGPQAFEWNAGYYFLRKEIPGGAVSRDFHDGYGITFANEIDALRVTIQIAEGRIEWGYEMLFEEE